MRNETIRSIKYPSKCPSKCPSKYPSLWLLAAAICLCPAAAQAQTNTATGTGALTNVTSGPYNTADGFYALHENTTGGSNTASGSYALHFNKTGNSNTASGYSALYNTTGNNNVAVGIYALFQIKGNDNIALGSEAGILTKSGNKNIYIGHPGKSNSENRTIRIGKTQAKTFIAGIAGKAQSGAVVVVNSKGRLGVIASSARYKQDIKPLAGAAGDVAEKLAQLRPVSFRYKAEPQATHYGLIAEEVDRVMPELVVRDGDKRPDSVRYQELIPLLLQQWKAQQAENARQRALIERLAAEVAELRSTRLSANTAMKN